MSVLQEASNVLDQLLADVRSKFADSQHQQGVLDAFRAFSSAVDWQVLHQFDSYTMQHCHAWVFAATQASLAMQETWLIAVLSIQTLLFCSVLVFRKNISYLTGVFVVASKWWGHVLQDDLRDLADWLSCLQCCWSTHQKGWTEYWANTGRALLGNHTLIRMESLSAQFCQPH
jgi:hypothetical protein